MVGTEFKLAFGLITTSAGSSERLRFDSPHWKDTALLLEKKHLIPALEQLSVSYTKSAGQHNDDRYKSVIKMENGGSIATHHIAFGLKE